jgi:23S rRNA (guanosine2251-2'-O)-methyltransferase
MPTSHDQLVYGRHPVLEALQADRAIDKIMMQRGLRGPFEKELRELCKQRGVPLQVVPKERLNALVRSNHQGVVALLAAFRYQRLEDLLPVLYERGDQPLLVLIDKVSDVRNFGAIARSAEICGAHALVTSRKGGAAANAEAVKASAGALSRLAVCRESSILEAVKLLQASGIRVAVSHLDGEKLLEEVDLTLPTALVLGSEGRGVSRELIQAADVGFRIPQAGQMNSFNVSVAAGIMLYEAMRQRLKR